MERGVRLMEQPLPQCLSTNSVPRAFFPQVAIGCRLSLKIDRNLSPFWAGALSVATWYNTGWIEYTASGEYLYRSVGSPAYLQASDNDYTPIRGQLRSSKQLLLLKPPVRTEIARRALSQAAPTVCKDLPLDSRSAETHGRFRSTTKKHFYELAFTN